jgi:hypothetical protein
VPPILTITALQHPHVRPQIAYKDPLTGSEDKVQAGRMECTMQNIADFMTDRLDRPLLPGEAAGSDLSTFLVYNMRRKVRMLQTPC